jgi:hypothetical protein
MIECDRTYLKMIDCTTIPMKSLMSSRLGQNARSGDTEGSAQISCDLGGASSIMAQT